MKHHYSQPDSKFIIKPVSFDKYTDLNMLQYCLGATMYMSGTRDFHDAIVTKKYSGLTSFVLCFEDACKEQEVPLAEENVIRLLNSLNNDIVNGVMNREDIPLLIIRVRNMEEFRGFADRLTREQAQLITAFNFPKFDKENGEEYFEYLKLLNERHSEIIYGMPILESESMAHIGTRLEELMSVRKILDKFRPLVLNVRVGGTDWSSVFGVRRGINYTIYDILPVADCLKDVLNVFARNNDYCVSGPVWEYFRAESSMKFSELPEIVNASIFRREKMINDAVDGLLRELLLDKANGFIGKTVIHPTHVPYVNGMLSVTQEIYRDVCQILEADDGVVKSNNSNKMNEVRPHKNWAEKLYMRAKVYGVIKDESCYRNLFTLEPIE